jgi:hypothetical protein
MATPKTVTDASSDLDEAVLNLFVRGGKVQVKVNYWSLTFTASTNAVTINTAWDSDGEIVDGDLVWNAGTTKIDITLTGFVKTPVVLAQIVSNSSTNIGSLAVTRTDPDTIHLEFRAVPWGLSSCVCYMMIGRTSATR